MSSISGSEPLKPNIFELLDLIRARPGMYLGYDDEHVQEQLIVLESLLRGYEFASYQLGYDDVNVHFLRELGRFIQPKLGYGNEIGPVSAAHKHNPDHPFEQFWAFVDEFRASRDS